MAPLNLADRFHRTWARLVRRVSGVEQRVVRLQPETPPIGRALVSYIIDPYLAPLDAPLPTSHTNYWEAREIGRILLSLGFAVDAIHWTNGVFRPREEYDLIVDVRRNLERLAPLVGRDCLKIMHIETAHPDFYNAAQKERLAALLKRRGIALPPYKTVEANRAIECADCATILGNERTQSTYRFAGKPLYPVPISQPILFPEPLDKPMETARRRFLWFGSAGMVHKGLDLTLDAFAGLPDFQLTVVGPVDRERAFARAYARELYSTPNIHTVGWLDIASADFLALASATLALVYPSCSEGQSGGTVTCLHAGLLPIVTPQVGLDIPPRCGLVLDEPTVDQLRAAAIQLASRSAAELADMARYAWRWARSHHTRERFSATYREHLLAILERFRPRLLDRIGA